MCMGTARNTDLLGRIESDSNDRGPFLTEPQTKTIKNVIAENYRLRDRIWSAYWWGMVSGFVVAVVMVAVVAGVGR